MGSPFPGLLILYFYMLVYDCYYLISIGSSERDICGLNERVLRSPGRWYLRVEQLLYLKERSLYVPPNRTLRVCLALWDKFAMQFKLIAARRSHKLLMWLFSLAVLHLEISSWNQCRITLENTIGRQPQPVASSQARSMKKSHNLYAYGHRSTVRFMCSEPEIIFT